MPACSHLGHVVGEAGYEGVEQAAARHAALCYLYDLQVRAVVDDDCCCCCCCCYYYTYYCHYYYYCRYCYYRYYCYHY